MNFLERRKSIQEILGVPADGVFGPRTDEAYANLKSAVEPVELPMASGLQTNDWPLEANASVFFGYPPNLTQIIPPYEMHMDDMKITKITCNIKVAASLRRIFNAIFEHYGKDSAKIHSVGLDAFDGVVNDRPVRGSSRRSMHAYGAAIDLDAEHNPLGSHTWRMPDAVVSIFKAESWLWN
jgi:hypothetical protein